MICLNGMKIKIHTPGLQECAGTSGPALPLVSGVMEKKPVLPHHARRIHGKGVANDRFSI